MLLRVIKALIILFPFISPKQDNYYSFDFVCIENSLYAFIKYGEKKQRLLLSVDIESSINYVELDFHKEFQSEMSNPVSTDETVKLTKRFSYQGKKYPVSVYIFKDYKTELNNVPFLVIPEMKKEDRSPSSSFALTRTFTDESNSIMRKLFLENKIETNKITFNFHRGLKTGILYFGKVFQEPEDARLYKLSLKAKQDTDKWEVDLDYLFLGEVEYNSRNEYLDLKPYRIRLRTKKGEIKFPKGLFRLFMSRYFDSMGKGICEESNEIICDCDKISTFKDLIFISGNKAIRINGKKLFTHVGTSKCKASFGETTEDGEDETEKTVYLGLEFFSRFSVELNSDENMVTLMSSSLNFYTVDIESAVSRSWMGTRSKLILVCLISSCVAIIGLVSMLWVGRQKEF